MAKQKKDKKNLDNTVVLFRYAACSFIIPILGFILYFVWKNKRLKTVETLLIPAIVNLIIIAIVKIYY